MYFVYIANRATYLLKSKVRIFRGRNSSHREAIDLSTRDSTAAASNNPEPPSPRRDKRLRRTKSGNNEHLSRGEIGGKGQSTPSTPYNRYQPPPGAGILRSVHPSVGKWGKDTLGQAERRIMVARVTLEIDKWTETDADVDPRALMPTKVPSFPVSTRNSTPGGELLGGGNLIRHSGQSNRRK